MYCATCGALIEESVRFCSGCGAPAPAGEAAAPVAPAGAAERIWRERSGAPRPREELPAQPGAAAAPAALPATGRFDFTGEALGFFFRGVGALLGSMLVIPAPWVVCWFAKWFVGKVRLSSGTALTFTGTPGSVAVLAVVYGLFLLASSNTENDELWSSILSLAGIPLSWAFFRWYVNHAQLGAGSFRFDGSVWGYIGWTLLTYLSILTIVGWAWVMAVFYRWIAGNVRHAEGTVQFVGQGHQILWRIPALILFCLPIVTMPWAIKWIVCWLIQQFEWRRRPFPSPAASYS